MKQWNLSLQGGSHQGVDGLELLLTVVVVADGVVGVVVGEDVDKPRTCLFLASNSSSVKIPEFLNPSNLCKVSCWSAVKLGAPLLLFELLLPLLLL